MALTQATPMFRLAAADYLEFSMPLQSCHNPTRY
jgi:hypothetical protein